MNYIMLIIYYHLLSNYSENTYSHQNIEKTEFEKFSNFSESTQNNFINNLLISEDN